MIREANPGEKESKRVHVDKQTVEFRCPDGSADIYLLGAGLAVAARHGLTMKDSLAFAEKTYVDVNIFDEKYKERVSALKHLPFSCWDSADALEGQRAIYQSANVFPPMIIDGIIKQLKSFDDQHLRESLKHNEKEVLRLVNRFLHCG